MSFKDNKLNYFQLLNLPAQFDLEKSEIENQYYQAILKTHPDKLIHQKNNEKKIEDSSQINQAYLEILDPLKRAIHLLHIEDSSFDANFENTKTSSSFLFEKMELYDKLESLKNSDDKEKLNQFQIHLKQKITEVHCNLPQLFNEKKFDLIKEKIMACQFYNKIWEQSQKY